MLSAGAFGRPLGYQHLTPTSATNIVLPTSYPSGITDPLGTTFRGVKGALISISTATVSFRDDGVAPTATQGVQLPVGTLFWYAGNLTKVQFISATGVVDIAYYG